MRIMNCVYGYFGCFEVCWMCVGVIGGGVSEVYSAWSGATPNLQHLLAAAPTALGHSRRISQDCFGPLRSAAAP